MTFTQAWALQILIIVGTMIWAVWSSRKNPQHTNRNFFIALASNIAITAITITLILTGTVT